MSRDPDDLEHLLDEACAKHLPPETFEAHAQVDEGERCPHFGHDCCGRMRIALPGPCGCGERPPCSNCENSFLLCDDCGYEIHARS